MRYAELKPDLPSSIFPSLLLPEGRDRVSSQPSASRKYSSIASPSTVQGDEGLYDDGVADEDMFEAGGFSEPCW